jgi:hypothetical protein
MNKFVISATVAATTFFSAPAFAQSSTPTTNIDALMAEIALQCEATGSLATCDQLLEQRINQLMADGTLDDNARAGAIARLVESATSALNRSSGPSNQVAVEIAQIVEKATTQLNVIKTRTPAAAAAVNSAVSRTTIAVLTVVQEKNLTSNTGGTNQVVNALTQLANTSSDTTQRTAVASMATKISSGASIVDIIEEIETVNSYASPA